LEKARRKQNPEKKKRGFTRGWIKGKHILFSGFMVGVQVPNNPGGSIKD